MSWLASMVWPTQYVLFNERKEEMKRVLGIVNATALLLSAFASVGLAQQGAAPEAGVVIQQERVFQGPEGAPLPPPRDFMWIAWENFGGKVVKNAPYSAESVTESVQTLSDGNRIVNKITSQIYRDSEGRTRRDQTLKGFGSIGSSEKPLQTIFINDPVAGVTYTLDTRTHVAHKSVPFQFELSGKPVLQGQRFEFKTSPGSAATSSVIITSQATTAGPGAPPQTGTRVAPAPPDAEEFRLRAAEGAASYVFRTQTD